jgi:nitroreductase
MDYQDFLQLIIKRRSIRSFTQEPVSRDTILKLLDAARYAPSGANSQPWEFIVIEDKQSKDKIVEMYKRALTQHQRIELGRQDGLHHPLAHQPIDDPGFKNAPVFVLVCGDTRTAASYPQVVDHARNLNSSLANGVLYILLSATCMGLGVQYVTSASLSPMKTELKELFKIPDPMTIYELLAVGHPAKEPKPRLIRTLEEMVHYEAFDQGKLKSDQQMHQFIKEVHTGRPFR